MLLVAIVSGRGFNRRVALVVKAALCPSRSGYLLAYMRELIRLLIIMEGMESGRFSNVKREVNEMWWGWLLTNMGSIFPE